MAGRSPWSGDASLPPGPHKDREWPILGAVAEGDCHSAFREYRTNTAGLESMRHRGEQEAGRGRIAFDRSLRLPPASAPVNRLLILSGTGTPIVETQRVRTSQTPSSSVGSSGSDHGFFVGVGPR